jgi:hypothetical protein
MNEGRKIFYFACFGFFFSIDRKSILITDLKLHQIVFVVLTQPNSYHVKRAQAFGDHFLAQFSSLPKVSISWQS